MKKRKFILFILALALVLSSCSKKTKSEEVVSAFLDAYKEADMKKTFDYTYYGSEDGDKYAEESIASINDYTKRLSKILFHGFDYKLNEVDEKEDHGLVKVTIQVKDLSSLSEELYQALSAKDDQELDAAIEKLEEKIADVDEMKEKTFDIATIKIGDNWYVDGSDQENLSRLQDNILSGLSL